VVAVAIVNGLVDLACLAYGQCNNWTIQVQLLDNIGFSNLLG
jgi:hypothetical protein